MELMNIHCNVIKLIIHYTGIPPIEVMRMHYTVIPHIQVISIHYTVTLHIEVMSIHYTVIMHIEVMGIHYTVIMHIEVIRIHYTRAGQKRTISVRTLLHRSVPTQGEYFSIQMNRAGSA